MGSGKSYTGKRLAGMLRLPYFDLDVEIEAGEEMTISNIFSQFGEAHFRRPVGEWKPTRVHDGGSTSWSATGSRLACSSAPNAWISHGR